MLKRAWFLIAMLWAAVFLANGSTKAHGIQEMDWAIALAPFVIGWLLVWAGRSVVGGR